MLQTEGIVATRHSARKIIAAVTVTRWSPEAYLTIDCLLSVSFVDESKVHSSPINPAQTFNPDVDTTHPQPYSADQPPT